MSPKPQPSVEDAVIVYSRRHEEAGRLEERLRGSTPFEAVACSCPRQLEALLDAGPRGLILAADGPEDDLLEEVASLPESLFLLVLVARDLPAANTSSPETRESIVPGRLILPREMPDACLAALLSLGLGTPPGSGEESPGGSDRLARPHAELGGARRQSDGTWASSLGRERFRRVLESGTIGVCFHDAKGRIRQANDTFLAMTGYGHQVLERGDLEIANLFPDESGKTAELLREISWREGSGPAIERRFTRGDGARRWGLFSGGRLETGNEAVCCLVDITSRKEAEEELRRLNEELEDRVAKRTRFLRLMEEVGRIANSAHTVDAAIHSTLEAVCRRMGWSLGHAYVRDPKDEGLFRSSRLWWTNDPDRYQGFLSESRRETFRPGRGLVGSVIEARTPLWVSDLSSDTTFTRRDAAIAAGLQTSIAYPILSGERVLGVLEFYLEEAMEAFEDAWEALVNVAGHIGRVFERMEWEGQLSEAVWAGQRRAGQEIHDGLGQQLTAIGFMAGGLERDLREHFPPGADKAKRLVDAVREAQRQTRAIMKGLMPVEIDAAGLMGALDLLASDFDDSWSGEVVFHCPHPVSLEDNFTATHLFRIAQEAVNNAVKHSGAERIRIELRQREGRLCLEVRDDGKGFEEKPDRVQGMGLKIMRHRAGLIRGSLAIDSQPGRGTSITCEVVLGDDRRG